MNRDMNFSWLSCMFVGMLTGIVCCITITAVSWLIFADLNKPFPFYVNILISLGSFAFVTVREKYNTTYQYTGGL